MLSEVVRTRIYVPLAERAYRNVYVLIIDNNNVALEYSNGLYSCVGGVIYDVNLSYQDAIVSMINEQYGNILNTKTTDISFMMNIITKYNEYNMYTEVYKLYIDTDKLYKLSQYNNVYTNSRFGIFNLDKLKQYVIDTKQLDINDIVDQYRYILSDITSSIIDLYICESHA